MADTWTAPDVITSLPFADTQDTTTATDDAADPVPTLGTFVGPSHNTVWYQWVADVSGRIGVHTLGSDYDTAVSVWTRPSGSFVEIASNEDQAWSTDAGLSAVTQSELEFTAVGGTTYYIMVGSYNIGGGNLVFHMNADTATSPISVVQSVDGAYTSNDVDSQGNVYRWGMYPTYDGDAPSASVLVRYASNVIGGSVTLGGLTLTGVTSGNTLIALYWANGGTGTAATLIEVAGLSQVIPREVAYDGTAQPVGAIGTYETAVGGATSHSHASPAATQNQPGLWLAVNVSNADATASTPSGFTAFGFNTAQRRAFYKVTTATEAQSAGFTTTSAAELAGGLLAFRVAVPVTPVTSQIIGSTVFGTKGTVTSTRTFLANLDDTTRSVNEVGTFYIGGKLIVTGPTTLASVTYGGTTDTPQFARLGLGVAPDASAVLKLAGQGGSTTVAAGSSSTAKTLNWNDGNNQLLTLTGNCTVTLTNHKDGFCYLLALKQDATGSRTVTWPSSVKWASGTAPTLTTTAGRVDLIRLTYFAGLGASGNYLAESVLNYTPA